jgi:hypothetical protein
MERLLRELAHVRHRLEVLAKTWGVVGLTAEERTEFDGLTEQEAVLIKLVHGDDASTAGP